MVMDHIASCIENCVDTALEETQGVAKEAKVETIQTITRNFIENERCLTGRIPLLCDVEQTTYSRMEKKGQGSVINRFLQSFALWYSTELCVRGHRLFSTSLLESCFADYLAHLPAVPVITHKQKEALDNSSLGDLEIDLVIPHIISYLYSLYLKSGLMHRRISYPLCYREGGSNTNVLLDFSLANCREESAISAISNRQDRKDIRFFYGTVPFMAIEANDLTNSDFKHHLCHDLKSLLYTLIWHDRKALRGHFVNWRVGSWPKIMEAKINFLSDPEPITSRMADEKLVAICAELARIFQGRRHAAQDACIEMIHLTRKAARMWSRLGIKMPVESRDRKSPSLKYKNAIYPAYAKSLGIDVGECEKDCCAERYN